MGVSNTRQSPMQRDLSSLPQITAPVIIAERAQVRSRRRRRRRPASVLVLCAPDRCGVKCQKFRCNNASHKPLKIKCCGRAKRRGGLTCEKSVEHAQGVGRIGVARPIPVMEVEAAQVNAPRRVQ